MKGKIKHVRRVLVDDASNWMDVTLIPGGYPGLHMEFDELEEEGIKKITLEIASKRFLVRIEQIDKEVTEIERDPSDEKTLIVTRGLFITQVVSKSGDVFDHIRPRGKRAMVRKFPLVFGKEKVGAKS